MPYLADELIWHDYNLANLAKLPESPGMYMLGFDSGARVIYVGKAKSVKSRLSSYGQGRCHNKWVKPFARDATGRTPFATSSFAPVRLQFCYRLTSNPAAAEALAIQVYRTAIVAFNQRNEWTPIGEPDDEAYQLLVPLIRSKMGEDQRLRFDQWLREHPSSSIADWLSSDAATRELRDKKTMDDLIKKGKPGAAAFR